MKSRAMSSSAEFMFNDSIAMVTEARSSDIWRQNDVEQSDYINRFCSSFMCARRELFTLRRTNLLYFTVFFASQRLILNARMELNLYYWPTYCFFVSDFKNLAQNLHSSDENKKKNLHIRQKPPKILRYFNYMEILLWISFKTYNCIDLWVCDSHVVVVVIQHRAFEDWTKNFLSYQISFSAINFLINFEYHL